MTRSILLLLSVVAGCQQKLVADGNDDTTDPATEGSDTDEPDTDPATDPDSETDPDTDPATDPDSETDPDTDPATDPDSETETETDPDTDPDSDPATDPDSDADVDPAVTVVWTGSSPSSQITLTIDDPLGRTSWNFGMAETGAAAAGWYGEDCYLGTGSYDLCHPVSGTNLSLDQVGSPGAVDEGDTTLLWPELELTFYLDDGAGHCWVWGHDTSYYGALGCLDLDTGATYGRRDRCSGMDPADLSPLGGRVALTFDDGPSTTVTPQIVEILRDYDIPATFFMLGKQAQLTANWDIVEDIHDDPLFTIGNHSWDHADLALLNLDDARDQVEDTEDQLAFLGVTPAFFRFPYGDSTCQTADMVRDEYDHLVAGWHADTGDWCYAGGGGTCSIGDYWRVEPAYKNDMIGYTLAQIEASDGGVVLMHDIHQWTADNLEDLILELIAEGYTFVHLDDVNAFPRLNADDPYDFRWMGESCSVSDDLCFEAEWNSWCEPTGSSDDGICALPCDDVRRCIDRDGVAPLFCADTGPGVLGYCLAEAGALNHDCSDAPGTTATLVSGYSGGSKLVCKPDSW